MKISRQQFATIAAQHLRETGNPSIMWGDEGLAHQIAEKAGLPHEGARTTKLVLDLLEGSPLFEKTLVRVNWGRRGAQAARCFNLANPR